MFLNESQIRNLVSENLQIFGENISLLQKEKFIPKTIGTKSFIDILAKDVSGNYIIIEIKRSNS